MAKNKEPYITVCRQHWSCFVGPGICGVLLLVGAVISLVSVEDYGGTIALILLIAAVAVVLSAFISYKTTYIALTRTKVVGHMGVIHSKTLMSPLSKIQNVGLSNGLMGKILNYHTITLSDAGGALTEYVFKRMGHAREFADAVHGAIEQSA